MSFFDLFVGSEQSKYASLAIVSVIFIICLSILVTNTEISISERVATVLFMILIVLFPVGMALFELTCMVNGDSGNSMPVCGYYAWVVTALIVFHCFIIVIFTLSSMFTYKKAITTVDAEDKMKVVSKPNAQQFAENMMNYESLQEEQGTGAGHEKPKKAVVGGEVAAAVAPVAGPSVVAGAPGAPEGYSTAEYMDYTPV